MRTIVLGVAAAILLAGCSSTRHAARPASALAKSCAAVPRFLSDLPSAGRDKLASDASAILDPAARSADVGVQQLFDDAAALYAWLQSEGWSRVGAISDARVRAVVADCGGRAT